MTIRPYRTLAVLVLFCALSAARAEDSATPEAKKAAEIVEKHIEAVGGAERIGALETLRIEGRLEQSGLELPFTLWRKRPDRNRLEVGYKGQFLTLGHGRGKTWWVNPLMRVFRPEAVPEEYAALVRRWADFDGPLVDYGTRGHRVEYAGEEKAGGLVMHKIKLTLASGEVWHVYIDARTFLEVKRTYPQSYGGRTAETTTHFKNYTVVEGVKICGTIEGEGLDGTPFTMTFSSFEANTPVDDARFEMR